jgi:hypothetical protein
MEDFFVNKAEELVVRINAAGFDSALEEQGLDKKSFGPLPINYGNEILFSRLDTSLPELSAAAWDENFWRTAFSTPLHTPSKPLVIGVSVVVLYPEEEIQEENDAIGNTYTSYSLSNTISQEIRDHFLKNKKLEDHFIESFIKYVGFSN